MFIHVGNLNLVGLSFQDDGNVKIVFADTPEAARDWTGVDSHEKLQQIIINPSEYESLPVALEAGMKMIEKHLYSHF